VLPLRGLLGDTRHRADLRPRPIRSAGRTNGVDRCGIELATSFGEFGDGAERFRVGDHQITWFNLVGPRFDGLGLCCSRRQLRRSSIGVDEGTLAERLPQLD
jgi:hypothetical protein